MAEDVGGPTWQSHGARLSDTGLSDTGLYGIAVAADLTGVKPPMLRVYEDRGLLRPARSPGGTRRYSDADVHRVKRITTLLAAGLNLAGVAHVLELEEETARLRAQITAFRRQEHPTDGPEPPTRE